MLQSGIVNYNMYKYFFFVNSSVRGPFVTAYARVGARSSNMLAVCIVQQIPACQQTAVLVLCFVFALRTSWVVYAGAVLCNV